MSTIPICRKLINLPVRFHEITGLRCNYFSQYSMYGPLAKSHIVNIHKHLKIHRISLIRYESSKVMKDTPLDSSVIQTEKISDVISAVPQKNFISEIPDPPVPGGITEVILNANGEPTFASLGLGGYGPIGLLESYFEFIHNTFDLPWWAIIILTSAFLKVITIPLAISAHKQMINTCNNLPVIVQMQTRMTEARHSGDVQEAAIRATELHQFMKEKNVSIFPIRNMFRVIVHVPPFIALRNMANAPVESLSEGGALWFPDLTIPDPYYILPLSTAGTMLLIAEYAMKSNPNVLVKYLVRGASVVAIFFYINFPGAVLCYWATANIITMIQNQVLQLNAVKTYFNIPNVVQHKNTAETTKKQNFKQALAESMTNMKISNKLARHGRADAIQFNQAGKGPLVKTFKYNPLEKSRVSAKK